MSDRQKLPINSGAPVSLPFHREFMLFACVYVFIVFFECWCSLLVSRGLYMSLDVGFWLLIRFFLFSIMPLRFNRRWPSDVRKLNVEHFWENPLIIFGTYIQLNRVYMCSFVWFLNIVETRTLRTIDPSDHWPLGLSTFRTTDPSDYQPFGPMTLRINEPSD